MNFAEKIPDRSQCDSAYSKLALMVLCSLFMIAAIGKQLPASAADTNSEVVSVTDLDLPTEKGMQAARERLHQTARRLCEKLVDPWSISQTVPSPTMFANQLPILGLATLCNSTMNA